MDFSDIVVKVHEELKRAEEKHPHFPVDIIHMVSIMNEESGEAVRAGLNYFYEQGDIEEVKNELIQTAAMCFRCLQNIEKLK